MGVRSDTIFGRVEFSPAAPAVWPWLASRSPSKCPVCEGRQTMPESFYIDRRPKPGDRRVKCRSCGGRGYIS